MCQPFFILGNPRSGTTIFRLMLNQHSKLVVPPECGFALWWFKKYRDWTYSEISKIEFLNDFLTSKKIENWHLDITALSHQIDIEKPATYAELVNLIYLFYASSVHKTPITWGDKNNFYLDHLNDLKDLFPNANILFISRDGRDVACSYMALNQSNINSKYLPKLPRNIRDIAEEWVDKNERIINYCSAIDKDKWYHVRFEDLLRDTAGELKKVCRFLGVGYDKEMLNYHEDNSEPQDTLQWKLKTKQAPDLSNIGKFKRVLSDEEISTFQNVAMGMLKTLAYA